MRPTYRAAAALLAVFLLMPVTAQTPEQVHTLLGASSNDADLSPPDTGHIVVQWTTDTYSPEYTPMVEYALDGGSPVTLEGQIMGTVRGGGLAGTDLHIEYGARVPVDRDHNMTYRVGDGSTWSGWFTVANPTIRTSIDVSAVVMSRTYYGGFDDDGTPDGTEIPTKPVVDLAINLTPDLVLHTGYYASGSNDKAKFDIVQRLMEPLIANVPIMPVPGPPDAESDYAQWGTRFTLPGIDDGVNTGASQEANDAVLSADDVPLYYYGFSAGPVYFVALNTASLCVEPEVPVVNPPVPAQWPCPEGAPNQDQIDWLHDTLEDAREDLKAPWIVAYLYGSPYVAADDGDDIVTRELLLPWLDVFNVDVIFSASETVYQRSYPIQYGQVKDTHPDTYQHASGPIHVISSGAGRSMSDPFDPLPPWVASSHSVHHVPLLQASNDTLTVTTYEAANGTVIDKFTIYKHGSPSDPENAPAKKDSPAVPIALVLAGIALALRRRP